ncbi:MAG: AAA family ATPase [Synechococcales cyanobacterium K44_A2020_017]|nr:AAA family ATPase [Synechococcales cyanobacterium K32_A2020_035]MBF2095740.1 AAA family ATPase [Synechococcales cyanobacterium K44_A2020_017]
MGKAAHQLQGYVLTDTLHETDRTVVYRALRDRDTLPVVVKLLKPEYPSLREISRFRYEYGITQQLSLDGVVKSYDLLECGNRLALVLEDFGGRSLHPVAAGWPIALDDLLTMAIQLADTLAQLHAQGIIHKDIKPANIIHNAQTRQTKLTDFSIAMRLLPDLAPTGVVGSLEGTLGYMSPEQTGRMNRTLDHRTDFYSFGVTLYELLVGHLPFTGDDPMELVHCHIAKLPGAPHVRRPEVPQGLSQVVMKLLEKDAEDRYQSAYGLKADLERCQEQWQEQQAIAPFPLGQGDYWDSLQIPEKLYGREADLEILLKAFRRVCQGRTELVLVGGYSGIGKSALVREIHRPVVHQHSYFTSGKFDQFKRDTPYSAFVQAFRELMRQIMAESTSRLQDWTTALCQALGSQGDVLAGLLPELEILLGPQPPVPELPPSEAQNRFNRVLQSFIQVFATAKHPLVIFLDDLQWADSASLTLIDALMSNAHYRHLLLVGAYRNNEVSATHPLMEMVEQVRHLDATVTTLELDNLLPDQVIQLVADTLHCDRTLVEPLSHLLFEKTQGNPFFLNQLLKSLYHDHLLTFDRSTKAWQWDLSQIQALDITENVVEFMVAAIQRLPVPVQTTLQLASCVGNRFDLKTLVRVHDQRPAVVSEHVWAAVQAGLLVPMTHQSYPGMHGDHDHGPVDEAIAYRFLHDRVQQAAYALIPDDQKIKTHLKVGRLLLKHTPADQLDDVLFDAVNALNLGRSLITDADERQQLIDLNRQAGKKAKASAAYQSALHHFDVALDLLPDQPWHHAYDLTLALHLEAAEAAYLTTDYGRSQLLVSEIEQWAQPGLDQVKAYELKIQFHMAQSQLQGAIAAGMAALEMLYGELPMGSMEDCEALAKSLVLPDLDQLESIPILTDPKHQAALEIMRIVSSPAYQTDPPTFHRLILAQVQLCLEHGHCAQASFAYAAYGWLMCSLMQMPEVGYQSGQIALHLLERFDAEPFRCSTYQIFETFIRHWQEPLRATLSPLLHTIRVGQDTGDISYTSYAVMNYCTHLFLVGEPLDRVVKAQQRHIDLLETMKQELQLHYTQIVYQLTLNLQTPRPDPTVLSGDGIDEEHLIPRLEATHYHQALFLIYTVKLILSCIFGDYRGAVAAATQAEPYFNSGVGLALSGAYRFYQVLAFLGRSQQTHEAIPQTLFQQALAQQPTIQHWAEAVPANYQHRAELITAELAQLQGDVLTAMDGYDRAIETAIYHGYLHEAAIACERAAMFYLSIGKNRIGQAYLTDAYYSYVRWGAIAKVRHMEQQYAQILNPVLLRNEEDRSSTLSTTTSTTASTHRHTHLLDMATVIKASQAISREIVLDHLLDTFLQITIENAGAQRGVFLMRQNQEWMIQADRTVDQPATETRDRLPQPMSQRSLPASIINYVANTHESLILDDAGDVSTFFADQYLVTDKPRSILCFPIVKQEQLVSVLYLEHKLTAGVFTRDRTELLEVLMAQLAISIENAQLYANLQAHSRQLENNSLELKIKNEALRKSEQRERERAKQLSRSLERLKQTQSQLIQTEKISSLGQLVAGVAHEVNNPVGFIGGNLTYAEEYTQDLMGLLALYQQHLPHPPADIAERMDDVDLDYLLEDLPKLLSSMKVGIQRIRDIMSSLRTFSRMDTTEKQPANVHDGIDSTLLILQHRLKAKASRPAIEVFKHYGDLPEVNCFAGQLNQVFMNLLANAIDAFEDHNRDRSYGEIEANPNRITIQTDVIASQAVIRLTDNGPGIDASLQARLFEPFFTTKEVGRGTGLGLSISRQIVEEQHGGQITLTSIPGRGTTFVIQIPL